MEPDQQDLEDKRRELGETEDPVEDELAEAFHSTVTEGAERLSRTWRALVITGLFGGVDVGLGIMAMLAVKEATGSPLLAGAAFGIGLFALRLAHSELFTEDFLVPIQAVVARHGTWLQLLRLWAVTLVTNLVGGWLFTWLIALAFPDLAATLLETAQGYLEGGLTLETAALAVLAGSTITLTTRMAQGTQNDVVTGFIAVMSGFLVVGTGMLHGALNSIVLFAAMHTGAPISYGEWALWALWVIPLNMVGGLVVITLPRLLRTLELVQEERAEQDRKRAEQGRPI
ncbi:formate/nitrite transporter family protein [Kocuria sp.]|jgi:formate/nitrite transporter FocA (FNT family)|uniref:formate/nitrite transporter family protein n=1 Tax=Kocuria sp. TaxID=1871328 RepID=UPI00281227E1|nr:formate/nitrite transporter family protein [Kocuria sp.]